jgi:hypothetical protein
MELMERIAARICQFLNSLYLHSARDLGFASVPLLETRLLDLGRKNLSFGDYVSSIELFLSKIRPATLHPGAGAYWNDLAAPLQEPVSLADDVIVLEMIKTARDRYAIPVAQLDQYVDDHPPGAQKKQAITTVLRLAATYRNAKAHHHSWFADEPAWYELILGRWQRILERVMLHPPVSRILTAIEIVNTQAVWRMSATGQYLGDAARRELDELRRPLGESTLSSSTQIAAGRHWARRAEDDKAPLQWMFSSREFPENVESKEQREQRFRARVVNVYLDAGTLRATDVDSILRPLSAELGIDDSSARQLEAATVAAIRAAEAEIRSGENTGAFARLNGLIRHLASVFADLEQSLRALDEERATRVYAVIENQWPISHSSLKSHTEMNPEDLDRALLRLLTSADSSWTIRKVERGLGKAHYRIPSPAATQGLTEALDRLRIQSDWIKPLRPVLEICQQFFLEEGHPELPDAIGRLLAAGQDSNAPSADDESNEVPKLCFVARGQLVKASSVPELFREIVRRFGNDSALQANVPFATGRRRNLVAREARHAAGHAFVGPLEFKDHALIFEANQSRYSALSNLRQWFRAADIPVGRAEIDGHSIDELAVPTAVEAESAAMSSEDLVLNVSFDGRAEKIAGSTAGTFLAAVVGLLVTNGRLKDEHLPVLIGRVRSLVAATPWHVNGRAFDSPVEAEGVFIESALTRKDARAHAADLCRQRYVAVLDADVDGERDT